MQKKNDQRKKAERQKNKEASYGYIRFVPEVSDEKECPDCRGSGYSPWGGQCERCAGTGMVPRVDSYY